MGATLGIREVVVHELWRRASVHLAEDDLGQARTRGDAGGLPRVSWVSCPLGVEALRPIATHR
jgi:hypothetical protein